jgi:hypothetical protein
MIILHMIDITIMQINKKKNKISYIFRNAILLLLHNDAIAYRIILISNDHPRLTRDSPTTS